MEVNGHMAIVSRGGGGLGQAVAKRLMAAGYRVAVLDEDGAAPDGCEFVRCDMGSMDAVREAVGRLCESGGVSVLVNCSDVPEGARLDEIDEEMWTFMCERELKAPFFAMQACVPHMIALGGGRVINVTSTLADVSQPGQTLYATLKAALTAMTREWAVDLCNDGILVSAVAPGARIKSHADVAQAIAFLADCATKFVDGVIVRADEGVLSTMGV